MDSRKPTRSPQEKVIPLQGGNSSFSCAYSDSVLYVVDKDAAVSDFSGRDTGDNQIDNRINQFVLHDDFHLRFGEDLFKELLSMVNILLTGLRAVALHTDEASTASTDFTQNRFHDADLFRPDDNFKLFHMTLLFCIPCSVEPFVMRIGHGTDKEN